MSSINVNSSSSNLAYELSLKAEENGEYSYDIVGPDGESFKGLNAEQANAKLAELGLPGLFAGDTFILNSETGTTHYDLDPFNDNNPLPPVGPGLDDPSVLGNGFSNGNPANMSDVALLFAAMHSLRERHQKLEVAGLTRRGAAKELVETAHNAELSVFKSKLADQRKKARREATVGIVAGVVTMAAAVGGAVVAGVGKTATAASIGTSISSAGSAAGQITTSAYSLAANADRGLQKEIDDQELVEKDLAFTKQLAEGMVQSAEEFVADAKKNKENVEKIISDWWSNQEQMTRANANV